ncbi:CDP-alcohol phosphatidyltransferase [Paragonimus heterotremus]|uniref:CDP-alcohol phosphatidyltransferase n=1 Tax=Paragonimus heterotremus TaxID=100268 RepID=A0A8J4WGC2_9TREM|nr:CDP-alcohol phosphatidyltransferase [Paragonimus heterotremus]
MLSRLFQLITMLTEQMERNLITYKYSSQDTSPLANAVMHPFWNWVTQVGDLFRSCSVSILKKFYPRWVAPNLLTFLGFLLTVAHFILLSFLNPHFDNPNNVPRWIWLLIAVMVFTAHTLDGTDGKQARRTQSSSALGELFDHGCDSWVVLFIPAVIYSICGNGSSPMRLLVIQWLLIWTFYTSHWEKYITGVLFLPWTFDFGQLSVTFMCILTYFYGPGLYVQPVIFGLTSVTLLEFILLASFVFIQIPVTIHNIQAGCPSGKRWHRGMGYIEALRPFVPMLILMTFSIAWAVFSPTDMVNRRPRLFLYCLVTVASNVCCELILAQMSKSRAPVYNWLVMVYSLVVCGLCLNRHTLWIARMELSCLVLLSCYVTLKHLTYAINLVLEIANTLNVPVFRVKPVQ